MSPTAYRVGGPLGIGPGSTLVDGPVDDRRKGVASSVIFVAGPVDDLCEGVDDGLEESVLCSAERSLVAVSDRKAATQRTAAIERR
jgi:hypothetical protein